MVSEAKPAAILPPQLGHIARPLLDQLAEQHTPVVQRCIGPQAKIAECVWPD